MASASAVGASRPPFSEMDGNQPSVICKSTPPYSCIFANQAWESLCGWTNHEMLGASLRCLQGPATDPELVASMMESVSKQESCVVPDLINCARQPDAHAAMLNNGLL